MVAATLIFGHTAARAVSEKLNIPPIPQNTAVWCWLAVSEMALRYHGVPNTNPAGIYQCGMAGLLFPATCGHECRNCTFPAGNVSVLVEALKAYPRSVQMLTGRGQPRMDPDYDSASLSAEDVVDLIDDGVPIIAGISPSRSGLPASEYVALIIGYRNDGETLIINDPFPFESAGHPNPYIAAGARQLQPLQYAIDRDRFEDRLLWQESIAVHATRSARPRADFPNFCCTNIGKLGPYPNFAYPEGDACHGTDAYGRPWPGRVCR